MIPAKRNEVRSEKGCLVCAACGLSELELPKILGEACFEVHHLAPLPQLTEKTETKLVDVSLVCANCHRMIHRSNPMMNVTELSNRLLEKAEIKKRG